MASRWTCSSAHRHVHEPKHAGFVELFGRLGAVATIGDEQRFVGGDEDDARRAGKARSDTERWPVS